MDILKSAKLGFGTSQIGGPSLINGKLMGAKPIPKNEALSILTFAFENGINFFDTSDKYGNAEELLGKAFSKKRGKVIIATKCGVSDNKGRNFTIPYINKCLENSLSKLKTDYIDIFQLAKPDPNEVTDELMDFFTRKIREGKIRYFGISVIGDNDGNKYISRKTIKSLQIFYNLLFTQNHELIKECALNNKFVIIRSPLNSGMLCGKYSLATKFCVVDPRRNIFCGDLLRERLENIENIKKCFDLSSSEVLEFALNFILSNKDVNVVIPAASKLSQLQDYIDIFKNICRFNEKENTKILNSLRKMVSLKKEGQYS